MGAGVVGAAVAGIVGARVGATVVGVRVGAVVVGVRVGAIVVVGVRVGAVVGVRVGLGVEGAAVEGAEPPYCAPVSMLLPGRIPLAWTEICWPAAVVSLNVMGELKPAPLTAEKE